MSIKQIQENKERENRTKRERNQRKFTEPFRLNYKPSVCCRQRLQIARSAITALDFSFFECAKQKKKKKNKQ